MNMKIQKSVFRHIITLVLTIVISTVCTLPAYAVKFNENYSLSGSSADKMVTIATAQLGRNGINLGYKNSEGKGDAWCAKFVSDVAKKAGESTAIPYNGGCRQLYNAIIKAGGKEVSSPQKGDIVFFVCTKCKFGSHNNSFEHTGIMSGNGALYISGNSGGGAGTVLNKTTTSYLHYNPTHKVSTGDIAVKYVRPAYKNATSDSTPSPAPSSSASVKTDNYYTIKNLGSGKMLNVYGSGKADGTNVTVYTSDNTSGQDFKFISNGSGTYILQPRCAPSSALNVNGYSAGANSKVDIWTKSGHSTQSWIVEYNSSLNGYVIRSANNSSYVLATTGSKDSSDVRLAAYNASDKYQIWTSSAFSDNLAPARKPTTLTFSPSSLALDLTNQKSQEVALTLGGDFSWGDKLYRSVSNPDVASVDWSSYESGAVFCPVITAKAVGETILTCSVVDKDTGITRATAQLKITVTPANYTVRYDANGGTNAPASQSKIAKQDLMLTSDCPKREGFTFAGWATSRNGSVQYRPGDSFTTDQDVTLYAIWEAENQVSLTLANDSFTVKPGEQATLRFTFTGDIGYPEAQLDESGVLKDAIGSWNADKCSGSVTFTAVRAGTGSVTINLRDKNDDLLISKTASIIVKEVAISEPSIQVAATQMNLVAGTGNARSNYAITNPQGWPVKWYSSDTSIVTVDANGSSTTVTPVRAGTATITASMSFDGITYESSCTVTVTQANVELSETSLEMVAGEAVSLYVLGNQNVTWSSTNPSVATVDRNGVVTALQSGYATIKAQLKDDPSMRALCYVTVTESDTDEGSISLSWYRNELSIDIGRVSGASLHANIYPAGQTITWMSSDPNVATVESYDDDSANVCAKSVGTAIITASFTYKGKTYSANSIVTVTSSFAPGPDDDRVFFGVGG